jgi:hypothetical protein
MRKKTNKYGIEVPPSVVRAKELDRINGNTLRIDALKLEMHNVGIAFEVLEDGKVHHRDGQRQEVTLSGT